MITAVFAVALLGFVSSAYCSALGSSNPRVIIKNTTFIGQSKSKDVGFFGGKGAIGSQLPDISKSNAHYLEI